MQECCHDGARDDAEGEKIKLIKDFKFPPREILTRRQINQSRRDVQDMHPLRQSAKWQHIVPTMGRIVQTYGCCQACRHTKKDFKEAVKRSMLAELELNVPTSEMDAMHDPYMTAGYGVNSYFENLAAISMMFIAISLCALPVFWIYSQGRSFEGYAMQPVAQFFIGNAGASATACRQSRVGEGFIDVSCPSSNILDGKSAVFGFISTEFARFTACHPAALEKDIVERGHHNCTAAVSSSQRNELALSIKQKCHGKTRCKVDFSAVNFRSLHNDPKGTKACNENAYFFLQMPCLIPREALPVRKVMGLFVCVFAVFVYFLVFVLVDYQRSAEAHKFVDWDVKTITAADYSVEFNIPESMYEAFVTRFHDPTNPISEIGQLRLYIKHEMERRLSAFPPLGMDGPEGDEMPVKIAMITFAFDNAEIIHGLRQRGKAIRNEKCYSLALINKRLTDRLHNSQRCQQRDRRGTGWASTG